MISINTIEHTPDPAQFLATLASLMTPDGQTMSCCPTTEFANDELLFFDHFWSISPAAMISFAARSGLRSVGHRGLAAPLAGFQLFRFARSASGGSQAAFAERRRMQSLISMPGKHWTLRSNAVGGGRRPAQAFGAGQMAALLRAYAPRTFAMFKRFCWIVRKRHGRSVPRSGMMGSRRWTAGQPLWPFILPHRTPSQRGSGAMAGSPLRFLPP